MNNSKTFCILPWIHAATYTDGSALLCCVAKNSGNLNLNNMTVKEVWNSQHFKNARLSMLAGEQFSACDHCYKEESSGIKSHRINENNLWSRELGADYLQDLVDNTNPDGSVNNDLITIDLRLGNTCNLQCLMCRPVDSSKWVKDAKILTNTLKTEAKWDWKHKLENYSTNNFEWYKNEEFWISFFESASDIKHIIFGGGEPLYIKEHKEIIKQLVDRGLSKNIELRYHTNGTIYNQEIVDLWEHFKHVEVMISLDGYNEVNSYIRYPSEWNVIEKNLELYDNTSEKIDPKILCTVQAININFLPEFADWLLSKNYKKISKKHHGGLFHPGILHWPQYLCVKVLPEDAKIQISKKLLDYASRHPDILQLQKFKSLVEFMNSEDTSSMLPQTIDYLDNIDDLHATDSSFFRNVLICH